MVSLSLQTNLTELYRNGFNVYSLSDDKLFGENYAIANKKALISFGHLQFISNGHPLFTQQLKTL